MHLFSAEFKINREKILLFFPQSFPVIYFQFPLFFFCSPSPQLLYFGNLPTWSWLLSHFRLVSLFMTVPIFFFFFELRVGFFFQVETFRLDKFHSCKLPHDILLKITTGTFHSFFITCSPPSCPTHSGTQSKKRKKKQGDRVKSQPPPDYPNCPAWLLTWIRSRFKMTLWLRAAADSCAFF